VAKVVTKKEDKSRHARLRRISSFDTGHTRIVEELKRQKKAAESTQAGGSGGANNKRNKNKNKNKNNRRPVAKRRHSSAAILPGFVDSP
jgi:hypothetical protein